MNGYGSAQVYSNRKSYTSVLPCRVQSTSGKPILFGTKFTMQADFYGSIPSTKYGISVVTPEKAEQHYIHRKFMTEPTNDCIVEEARQELSRITRIMADKEGIEALILGCTELPLILSQRLLASRFLIPLESVSRPP